jgi:hypothetical protein
MDESASSYAIGLVLAGALLWYGYAYHSDLIAAVVRWLAVTFPV